MDSQAMRILWCHLPNAPQTIRTNPVLGVREVRILVVTLSASYKTNKGDNAVPQCEEDFLRLLRKTLFAQLSSNKGPYKFHRICLCTLISYWVSKTTFLRYYEIYSVFLPIYTLATDVKTLPWYCDEHTKQPQLTKRDASTAVWYCT